jgi:hypothetical protein
VVLQLRGLSEVLTTPFRENVHVMNYPQDEMLPLEIKQSGVKLLPHSVLREGGVFPEEVSRSFRKRKRDIMLGTWNVRSLYRAGSFTALTRELARRWMFRKLEGVVGTEWSWLRIGTGGGHL